jgi:hypothetical protein
MVWQPTAIWCQRLAEGLLSVILSKFVLAASFALAIEALGQADSGQGDGGGFTTMIAGGAAFLIAALTPWVLFGLIPMTHTASSQSVNRQQVSGAISSMPGATMAKMATQTLMYGRFGRSGGGSAQAATAQPPASAARRTDAGADAPVAVIPDPKPQPRSRPSAR